MDDVQLANYMAGTDPGPVEAWRADHVVANVLQVPIGTRVWLSDYNLTKIGFGHPEIDYQDYLKLPVFLSSGFVALGRRERSVEVYALELVPVYKKSWRVCLKATRENKIFITTFHQTNRKELRRVYKRARIQGRLVRDVPIELAQRHLRRASSA